MQKYNATVISTTGAPGTGKTYSRCARFLWDWWLPEEVGVHWSNFPVNIEKFVSKFSDAEERIRLIPREELAEWAKCDGVRGPWSFFEGVNLQGAHIAIDECHNYLRRTGKGVIANSDRWQRWLGEIRHLGCTVEFLSQDPHKVHQIVEQHSAVRIQLVNSEDRRDPIFGCLLGDWYELRATLTGQYETVVWQLEERRLNGKWRQSGFERFTIQPEYFVLYDSFNTPQHGGVKAAGQSREFQKRGRIGLFAWFCKRNWWRFLTRGAVAACVLWLCLGGGISWAIAHFNAYVQTRMGPGKATPLPEPSEKKDSSSVAASVKEPPPKTLAEARVLRPTPLTPPVLAPAISSNANLSGEVVRSETFEHGTLERPVEGEVQQEAVPRVVLISGNIVAMDDGLMVSVGEQVDGYALLRIDYPRRCCVFRGVGEDASSVLTVPLGGPVGRVRKAGGNGARSGSDAAGVPKLVPRK